MRGKVDNKEFRILGRQLSDVKNDLARARAKYEKDYEAHRDKLRELEARIEKIETKMPDNYE